MPLVNTELVIQAHRPWRNILGTLILLALFVAVGFLGYLRGRDDAGGEFTHLTAAREELLLALRGLESDNTSLRERVAVLEREIQVERQAYFHVDQTLKDLQDERLDLWEELTFFRGVVTNKAKNNGVSIQDFKLLPVNGEKEYRFKLVLTQVGKNAKVMEGTVKVMIDGTQEGSPTRLGLPELSNQRTKELSFRFNYFQRLEGKLSLPDNFAPHRLSVTVIPSERPRAQVVRTYEWPALFG